MANKCYFPPFLMKLRFNNCISKTQLRFYGIQRKELHRCGCRASCATGKDRNLYLVLRSHNGKRTLMGGFPKLPFADTLKGKPNKKLEYSERRILGYTMEQMYNIVSDVGSYTEFVPWCKESTVNKVQGNHFKCNLTVGFPPLVEKYTSIVTVSRPYLVRSECTEGKLFNYLVTIWRFSPGFQEYPNTCTLDFSAESTDGHLFNHLVNLWRFGPGIKDNPQSCTLDFSVGFEFRSSIHSQLATMFFDEIVKTMVNSFLKRAEMLHGPQSIKNPPKKIIAYSSS